MPVLFLIDGALAITLVATLIAWSGPRARGPAFYALPGAVAILLLYQLAPSRSLASFGAALLVAGGVYAWRPYASAVPLAAAALASPAMRYLDAVAGFELRLLMSEQAANVFRLAGKEVAVIGNAMVYQGERFSVDAECIGVHLLLSGLAASVALLSVVERRRALAFRPLIVGVLVSLTVGLVAAANLTRILILVQAGWGPSHPGHEGVGLLAFGVYVIVPLALLCFWLAGRTWAVAPARSPVRLSGRGVQLASALVAGVLLVYGLHRNSLATLPPGARVAMPELAGVSPTYSAHDVAAYRLDDALVYVKPVPAFYSAEHSPTICWRGSGYVFRDVTRHAMDGGGKVYAAVLQRAGQQLYTAWWMSDGSRRTIDQPTWRRDMAAGGRAYNLINVTAATEAALWDRAREVYSGPAGL